MQGQHLAFVLLGDEPIERAAEPLLPMDGRGLLASFVHAQDQAAVHQLFVNVDGRGGQERHHRAADLEGSDAACLQVGQRLGRLLQGLVVVVDDLAEQGLLVGVQLHRGRQRAGAAALRGGTFSG